MMTFEVHTMSMSSKKGFTLIEMMITLAIAAILLTVAVPSFTDLINSNKLATDVNRLIGSIHFAKSEAIKRNNRVSICGGTSGPCDQNWNNGYRIFIDNNSDCVPDSGEPVVRVSNAIPSSEQIIAVGCVSFGSSGAKSGGSNNANNPDFVICTPNLANNNGRQVFITPVGNPRVVTVTQNSCP